MRAQSSARPRPRTGLLAVGFLLAGLAVGVPAPAAADLKVKVVLTVDRIEALDSFDEPGSADFYVVSTIDGQERSTDQEAYTDEDDMSPDFEFSALVDLDKGSVPVTLEVWEDDDGFLSVRGDDEQADINGSTSSKQLTMEVDLAPCAVGGDLSRPCDTAITSEGGTNDVDDDENARVTFRVEVDEPPAAPGLNVRCMHSPLAPEPGDTVEVTVQALDGALAASTLVAEQLEVWTSNGGPAQSQAYSDMAVFTLGPVSGPDFTYGCRVVDEGVPVFTGFRLVGVGTPAGEPVPVLYTGPPASRLDLVLVADGPSYDGTSASFDDDARGLIASAYYAYAPFLTNQDKFNFWVAPGYGKAEDSEEGCDHELPDTYDELFGFADSGVLVHTFPAAVLRNCAPGGERLFSTRAFDHDVTRHETGHRPFGLADEYCFARPGSMSGSCDGGYYQSDELPNVYESLEACEADAPALGRVPSDCGSWTERDAEGDEGDTFWTSEPVGDDLMVDNRTARAADLRRIDWMFGKCTSAQC